jgi:hypothetical protein
MTQLSRNEQVIKYFAQQCKGIPRKRLVKMAYLSDMVARQYLGHAISDLSYVAYHFGPYPPEIKETVDSLVEKELAWTEETGRAAPDEIRKILLFDTGRPTSFSFSRGEVEVLAFVVRNYLDMPMDELLTDVVYETAPFKVAKENGGDRPRIPMEMVDNTGTAELGFNLEEILLAEEQVASGQARVGSEGIDAIRGRLSARH